MVTRTDENVRGSLRSCNDLSGHNPKFLQTKETRKFSTRHFLKTFVTLEPGIFSNPEKVNIC